MINKFVRLIIVFGLLAFSFFVVAQESYSRLIVFGDSLSDTGNLAAIAFDFPPPYYENRISDGPIALDYLAESIGSTAEPSLHLTGVDGGYNYAIAGGNILGDDVEDLEQQVDAYLGRVANFADPEALYVLIMGGNDIRGLRSVVSIEQGQQEIGLLLEQLFTQLNRLIDAGARNILLSNVANIGRIPETLQRERSEPGVIQRETRYTQNYNDQLAIQLTELSENSNAQLVLFDLYAEFEAILDNSDELGFSQTEVGCFDTNNFSFHRDCFFGTRFDRFVFFDNLHPTNAANQIVAQAMISNLDDFTPIKPDDSFKSVIPIGVLLFLLED